MGGGTVTHVEKACAYITRDESELLMVEGPGHDDLQIPKGAVEPDGTPLEAVSREVVEESGLATFERVRHLITDVWTRHEVPPKRYVRSIFHLSVHERRDAWAHTVTGGGAERGAEFAYRWLDLPTDAAFALDLDDYLPLLPFVADDHRPADVARE